MNIWGLKILTDTYSIKFRQQQNINISRSKKTDEHHVKEVKDLMLKNRRLTIRDVTDFMQISFGSIQSILKEPFEP